MDMRRQLVLRVAVAVALLAVLFGSYLAFDQWLGAGDLALASTALVLVIAFFVATYILRNKVWI